MNNFNWSLSDLENMLYWERDIYIKMAADYQEAKKQKQMSNTEYYAL
jgi:hypothetical protein